MNNKQIRARFGLAALSILLVLAMLAAFIPEQVQAATDSGTVTAYASNGRIYVNASGFNGKHAFLTKVRDATQGIGGWKVLGRIKVDRKTNVSTSYPIPKTLAKTMYLNLCLKDMMNDQMTCRIVVNPGY